MSYEEGRAQVSYDSSRTSPAEFIGELERMTGYHANVIEPDTRQRHPEN